MSATDLRLTHYAAEPLTALDDRWTELYREAARLDVADGAVAYPYRMGKPRGLWVSVDGDGDGWADWCRAQSFEVDRLAVAHDVTLTADARILHLDSAAALDEFTARYPGAACDVGIDWLRVADDWQGIVIAPYQWARRLSLLWYYGWDCASGCIWDLSAVAAIAVRCGASSR